MKKVCIVSVHYDNIDLTQSLVKSLLAASQSGVVLDIVIVNNSERDSDSDLIPEGVKVSGNITVLNCRNEGYFPGLNAGLKFIDRRAYNFVVICNNDLVFKNNFFRVLFDEVYEEDVFALAPDVVTEDGVHQNPHVANRLGLFSKLKLDLYYSRYWVAKALLFLKRALPKKAPSGSRDFKKFEIYMGIGAIYVLTESFFKNNESLYYPFFLYGEEAFFSNQVHEGGGKILYDPSLTVIHQFSATTSKLPSYSRYRWSQESYRAHRSYL